MTTLATMEEMLDTIDRLADEQRTDEIKAVVARARAELGDDTALVTTTQAARLLGIGSINTVKAMVRGGEITGARKVGNRTMIPLTEIRRLQETPLVRDLRAINDAMTRTALLDDPDEDMSMSQGAMDALEAGRPGTPPWAR